jgi:hypothetical protein
MPHSEGRGTSAIHGRRAGIERLVLTFLIVSFATAAHAVSAAPGSDSGAAKHSKPLAGGMMASAHDLPGRPPAGDLACLSPPSLLPLPGRPATAFQQTPLRFSYAVSIPRRQEHLVHVTGQVTNVAQESVTLWTYLAEPLGFVARAPDGTELSCQPITSGDSWGWVVPTSGLSSFTFEYDQYALLPSPGASDSYIIYCDENAAILDTNTSLCRPSGPPWELAGIDLQAPPGWVVAYPWGMKDGVVTPDLSISSNAFAFFNASRVEAFSQQVGTTQVEICLYNRPEGEPIAHTRGAQRTHNAGEFAAWIFQAFADYLDLVRGFPYPRYVIILSRLEDGRSVYTTSGAHGSSYSAPFGADWYYHVHEMFHSFHLSFFRSSQPDAVWFGECMTQYYSEFYRWADLTPTGVAQFCESMLQNEWWYYLNRIVGTAYDVPLTEAETSGGAERVFLIYGKSSLVHLLLDRRIRETTAGRCDFDGFVRYFYQYGLTHLPFTDTAQIQAHLEAYTGASFQQFFADYIYGTVVLPMAPYLGDPDRDSLANFLEADLATNLVGWDTDADGIGDGGEVISYRTDPLDPDTDSDGASDGSEVVIAVDGLPGDWAGIPALALDPQGDGESPDLDIKSFRAVRYQDRLYMMVETYGLPTRGPHSRYVFFIDVNGDYLHDYTFIFMTDRRNIGLQAPGANFGPDELLAAGTLMMTGQVAEVMLPLSLLGNPDTIQVQLCVGIAVADYTEPVWVAPAAWVGPPPTDPRPFFQVAVNAGAQCTNSRGVTLNLAASDAVEMRFRNEYDVWSVWEPYTTMKAWTLLPGDGTKRVLAQGRDAQMHESAEAGDEILFDTAPPNGLWVTVNDGAACSDSANVTLTMSATGAAQMRFRNEGGTWSAWEPFTTSKLWTLSSSRGTKTVGFQAHDGCGNTANEVTDTIVRATFDDVVCANPQWAFVEALVRAGITAGCLASPPMYCPYDRVTRAQMAKLLCIAAGKEPLDRDVPTFADVPKGLWAYGYIERLADPASWAGTPPTSGCQMIGAARYFCPFETVTREQMAKFLCMAAGKSPMLSCNGTFADVASASWACPWIECLADPASWGGTPVTSGCACPSGFPPGARCFCPKSSVTRSQMAVFLVRAFAISL